MEKKEILSLVYQALDDKKAQDIIVLDIHAISTLADYFVIAGASSFNQMQAMADLVEEKLSAADISCKNIEGAQNTSWILMDYGDMIVHIFRTEDRNFYDLERIWRDAKNITSNFVEK